MTVFFQIAADTEKRPPIKMKGLPLQAALAATAFIKELKI